MKTNVIVGLLVCLCTQACSLYARGLYVNPATGSDSADGLSAVVHGTSGPVRSIAKAIGMAKAGDTIYLGGALYKGRGEYIGFYGNIAGEPNNPIVVDGQGAIIDGSIPLDPNEWTEISPGLYKNQSIFEKTTKLYGIGSEAAWIGQFCLIYDGVCNRMGISGKWAYAAYKNPSDLQAGEWTCQKKERAFYIKTAPNKSLKDYNIEVPVINSGVQIDGTISHIVFRNITVTHVINDGFALTNGNEPNSMVRDILYENIKAINICDDGFSAHGDCDVRVDGFLADDCATGIASCGSSFNTHVITRNIQGADIYFGVGKHVVTNSYLDCKGGLGTVLAMLWTNPGFTSCSLTLDNVFIKGNKIGSNMIKVDGKAVSLYLRHTSICDLSIAAINGGTLELEKSVVGGRSSSIDVQQDAIWKADRNIYDVNFIRVGRTSYSLKDFDAYKKATGQDTASKWMSISVAELLDVAARPSGIDKTIGCNMTLIPNINTLK